MEDKCKKSYTGKGVEIFTECIEAMMYSDEEIREAMSPEDADEYISLRNTLVSPASPRRPYIDGCSDDVDIDLPMAAENEAEFE